MENLPALDDSLLQRYDRAGPRYTSYPAAPRFHEGFGQARLRQIIARTNEDPVPHDLSLYVHVPFCESPCFYCGCNRIITRDKSRGVAYLAFLEREIERIAPLFDADRRVVQLHFGGGTPNFLTPVQIGGLLETLRTAFHFSESEDRDISIELDPRFVTPADIAELAKLGFNRASLGVQDFDAAVQKAVNREQGIEATLDILRACRQSGMKSVNVDLIYGLPKQTLEGFSRTLDTVLDVRPERFAIYGYAHLPEVFRAQIQIDAADLPNATLRIALLRLAIEKLVAAGYVHIGMDHFALPEDELSRALQKGSLHRNFMGYTTHADTDLIGLGVSAISHIDSSFSQNPRDLPAWQASLEAPNTLPVWRGHELDADDLVRADVIGRLMCTGEVDIGEIERDHDIVFDTYFADALARLMPLMADDLVTVDFERIRATKRGRLLLRHLAMCFDAYLHDENKVLKARFSKAI